MGVLSYQQLDNLSMHKLNNTVIKNDILASNESNAADTLKDFLCLEMDAYTYVS